MNMNEMMSTMMEQLMPKMMEAMMTSMMNAMVGSLNPTVAPAEAEAPAKPKTMSREDFLALEESKPTAPVVTAEPLDLVISTEKARTLVFNKPCSSDQWTINYLNLKRSFPHMQYNPKTHGFHWNTEYSSEFKLACQSFQVTEVLTDADSEAVKQYRREKAQRRAEYYAKQAEQ